MGKIVAIAGIFVFLGAAGTGGYVWKTRKDAAVNAANGLVVAPPPPVSAGTGADVKPADPPPAPADPPPVTTLASTAKPGSGTVVIPTKPSKTPPATTKPVTSIEKPAVTPPTPPTSHEPTPPAKKPPTTKAPNDPGY
jgi:hypothetical protein